MRGPRNFGTITVQWPFQLLYFQIHRSLKVYQLGRNPETPRFQYISNQFPAQGFSGSKASHLSLLQQDTPPQLQEAAPHSLLFVGFHRNSDALLSMKLLWRLRNNFPFHQEINCINLEMFNCSSSFDGLSEKHNLLPWVRLRTGIKHMEIYFAGLAQSGETNSLWKHQAHWTLEELSFFTSTLGLLLGGFRHLTQLNEDPSINWTASTAAGCHWFQCLLFSSGSSGQLARLYDFQGGCYQGVFGETSQNKHQSIKRFWSSLLNFFLSYNFFESLIRGLRLCKFVYIIAFVFSILFTLARESCFHSTHDFTVFFLIIFISLHLSFQTLPSVLLHSTCYSVLRCFYLTSWFQEMNSSKLFLVFI